MEEFLQGAAGTAWEAGDCRRREGQREMREGLRAMAAQARSRRGAVEGWTTQARHRPRAAHNRGARS